MLDQSQSISFNTTQGGSINGHSNIHYIQILWNTLKYYTILVCAIKEGTYVRNPIEDGSHFMEISKKSEGIYEWKDDAGVKCTLTPIPYQCDTFEVGDDCSYYQEGFKSAQFNESGIYGRNDEFYTYQGM